MNEQKKENGLLKENEQMNRKPAVLSDEMLQQVSGGGRVVPLGCKKNRVTYCGDTPPCEDCPNLR